MWVSSGRNWFRVSLSRGFSRFPLQYRDFIASHSSTRPVEDIIFIRVVVGPNNTFWLPFSMAWGHLGRVAHIPESLLISSNLWILIHQVTVLCCCSFSNLSVTSPTSQLILQPFRGVTYVTANSPTLPLFHLRHSSFFNPSFASTSQALHIRHMASRPSILLISYTNIINTQIKIVLPLYIGSINICLKIKSCDWVYFYGLAIIK